MNVPKLTKLQKNEIKKKIKYICDIIIAYSPHNFEGSSKELAARMSQLLNQIDSIAISHAIFSFEFIYIYRTVKNAF